MPEQVVSFRTADGQVFEDERQAQAHEQILAEIERVDAALPELDPDAPRGERAKRSRERETVLRFLAKERAMRGLEGALE